MLGGLWEPRQAFFREVTWKKWSATALGTPRCSFLFLFFKNCGHLVLAPQLDLGWKPHIWNVLVFPLTGEYFGVCYLILLVRLPCCDQVPLPRRLGSHPPLGWRSLVPGPTGSLWALIMWLMMALKLIPHKVDLGGDLEQNWQETSQQPPVMPIWAVSPHPACNKPQKAGLASFASLVELVWQSTVCVSYSEPVLIYQPLSLLRKEGRKSFLSIYYVAGTKTTCPHLFLTANRYYAFLIDRWGVGGWNLPCSVLHSHQGEEARFEPKTSDTKSGSHSTVAWLILLQLSVKGYKPHGQSLDPPLSISMIFCT